MAPHILSPYTTYSRMFAVRNGLNSHFQMHHPDHVNTADAVALGSKQASDDPEDDGESVVDAGGGAGACGAAGDVPLGGVDDGEDADASPHCSGWSSGSSASTTTTDDQCPNHARTYSSDSATRRSKEVSDGSTLVTDSDEESKSEEEAAAEDSPDENNKPNVNTFFVESQLRIIRMHGPSVAAISQCRKARRNNLVTVHYPPGNPMSGTRPRRFSSPRRLRPNVRSRRPR